MTFRRSSENRGEPDVAMDFDHHPSAPGRARRALEPLIDGDGDPIADDVRIVASELVSNVVQHTEGGGTMRAWDPKPDVPFRIEVDDPSQGSPESPNEAGAGGRGLRMVDALSDNWGVDRTATGKTVWAEFDRTRGSTSD